MGQHDQNQKFYVGLKAFIADGKKLLVLQGTAGQWELPGGRIQVGETIPAALKRELKEEIGESVQVEIGPIFHVWIREPNPDFFIFLVGFPCIWKSGEITISPEHKSFRWITKEEIDTIEFENTYKEAVEYYFKSSL